MSNSVAIDALRILSMEQINKASSGHPGIALGAAPIMHSLYSSCMNYNCADPNWINRDRFILAAGHGSSLLYSTLHMAGFALSLDDLKNFRQMESKTPGHPERGLTPGVDMSTGPLGQGIANGVGFAIAEAHLAAKYNNEEIKIIDHYTYVLCGDGDLQEGVTQEAMSLAGLLKLGKLIVLYDSNDIQLDGKVSAVNTEDVKGKYKAMNWHYERVIDGDDFTAILKAVQKAKKNLNQPSIIEIKTKIGHGSSLEGTSQVHGSPLSKEEVIAMRKKLISDEFTVSPEAYKEYYKKQTSNTKAYKAWKKYLALYKEKYNAKYLEFMAILNDDYQVDLDKAPNYNADYVDATRTVGGKMLEFLASYPTLIGGAADVSSSIKVKGPEGDFTANNRLGRNINFGVREHAMGAISNGIAAHGAMRVFCGTFFAFSDYMKPAIRMASMMELPIMYIYSHDSIAVGEDGPTHQPIEHITMLRSIPNLHVLRPADANETKIAYKIAIESKKTPTVILLTRQKVAMVNKNNENIEKGAYIISNEKDHLDGIIIASGSEVKLALDAQAKLLEDNIDVRVVSMFSTNLFEKQTPKYKEEVLPSNIRRRLALEASDAEHFYRYVGLEGKVIGINGFGYSAKPEAIFTKVGLSLENVIATFKKLS